GWVFCFVSAHAFRRGGKAQIETALAAAVPLGPPATSPAASALGSCHEEAASRRDTKPPIYNHPVPAAQKNSHAIKAPNLSKLPWLIHAFSTRAAGNLALPINRSAFEKSVGAAKWPMATLKQVLSDVFFRVGSANDC